MSRILHHVKTKDFRKTRQRKLDEQRLMCLERRAKEIKEQKEREDIEKLASPFKYKWRKKLNEGMTSSGIFFASLPATGDVDLTAFDTSNSSSYVSSGYVSYDQGGLSFKPYGATPYAITNVIDTSTSDSFTFTGFANPSFSTQSDLGLFWYNNDTGQYGDLSGITRTSTSSSTYTVNLPLAARGKNVDFTFYQLRTSANSSQDFVGKPIYIGGQLASIDPRFTSSLASSIVSLLINYGNPATTNVDLGRSIMFYASQNPSQFPEYASIQGNPYYPGIPGPVSGNIGDPNITGFNGDLNIAKNNVNSIGFLSGFFGSNTQQQMIDLFYDTTLNGSQFYLDLREWDRLFNLSQDFYQDYIYYSGQGNESLANYYLNLSNTNGTLANNKATTIKNSVNAASTLPDSAWTNADYERVAVDIYNLYKDVRTYKITNISTRRRSPVNVLLGLDNPEATNFIRTDPIMRGLSSEERLKKLEDMLDAGDEYLLKQLGMQGSVTRPADTGNIPSWEQSAGDEVAQLYPADYDKERAIDQMLLKGLQRGDYGTGPDVDRQIRQLQQNLQKGTPGGLPQASAGQDTQIAQVLPIEPAQQRKGTTGVGVPDTKNNFIGPQPYQKMNYPKEWLPKQANQGKMPMVASYEPEGQIISEKKLRSPKEVIHKIPGYYDGKPAPLGFPDNPPPETINGFHPDLVDGKNVANRFNRLDPQSAKAMPLTGNPYIDAKVKKARIG